MCAPKHTHTRHQGEKQFIVDLPLYHRRHIERQKCKYSRLRHVASFGYPQHGHRSRLHDVLFPANKSLSIMMTLWQYVERVSVSHFMVSKILDLPFF